ncbi:MAG: hypothetical protein JEZ06_09190 [Anaerolineaceae bacterium]|nr:hypothetical protein [Anaerolineaceae bacterium]
MKRSIFAIYIILLLTACTTSPQADNLQDTTLIPSETPANTATAAESIPPEPTFTASPTVIPSPTPVPVISVLGEMDIPQPTRADMLTKLEPGIFEVTLEGDIWQNHPDMPAFIWKNLQPDIPGLHEIILEFDLIETTPKWDDGWFGYERGYFLSLDNYYKEGVASDVNGWSFDYHLLAINLDRYTEKQDNHIVSKIPVTQLRGGARDLVLQFLPGTTFGNLRVYVTHDGRGTESSLQMLQEDKTYAQTALQEIYPDWWDSFGGCDDPTDMYSCMRQTIYEGFGDEWNETLDGPREHDHMGQILSSFWWVQQSLRSYMINADGSVNIPVADYDLGHYANEIDGDFAVIPDGLIFPLIRIQYDILGDDMEYINNAKEVLVDFLLTEMMNPDTGLIQGIWDIQQNKLVAVDRRTANLPLWAGFANLKNCSADIDQATMNNWLINIINNEFQLVGEKVYYTPRGIDEQGIMELRLEDFAFIDTLYASLYQVAMADPGTDFSLPDPEAVVTIMEGTHNSLALIIEQQELNPTHLPSETLRVHFDQQGNYDLEPVGNFSMDNPFFAVMPLYLSQSLIQFDWIGMKINNAYPEPLDIDMIDHFPAQMNILQKSNVYSPNTWYAALSQARTVAGEFYYSHQLMGNAWKLLFHVYNFAEQQPAETVFAEEYDIETGKPLPIVPEEQNEPWAKFQGRFGSLSAMGNWFQLMAFFYNQEMVEIALSLNEIGLRSFESRLYSDCEGSFVCADSRDLAYYVETGLNPASFDSEYVLIFQGSAPGSSDGSGYGKGNYFSLRYAETFEWRESVESWAELLRLMDESDGFMGRKLRELKRDNPGFVIPNYPSE